MALHWYLSHVLVPCTGSCPSLWTVFVIDDYCACGEGLEFARFLIIILNPAVQDLFDLDDSFSSERVRLAQLTNKCNEDDLEYFVRECGEIFMVKPVSKDSKDPPTGTAILEIVMREVSF